MRFSWSWSPSLSGSAMEIYRYLTIVLLAQQTLSICIPPNHCIENMDYSDAKELYSYVLSKYDELQMKISGEPLGLHGKVVTHGNIEEQHIVFQLMDNTPHDVIQSCVFVVTKAPDECESIVTVCNTFLGRTPRPLLERKPLTVCEDGVREAEVETEVEVEPERGPEAEDTDDANEGKEATPATAPDVDVTSDSELI
ncbi:uncharacterized protein LOC108653800 isoform X2 [Drosophila navojoa]|uniref:uncharacterized protein LOC108653800 isoform X2 n=1 Tax=Drosophila navojoa TaxID=7232 RepID=UPI0011BFB810|nr:uncharacterized protein LOC108653800 isoform X2 [Drosophila navojoa]